MTAGTGISHSEYNASQSEPVHFLQIWITPDRSGLKPGYEQGSLDLEGNSGKWVLVAAGDPRRGAIKVHQNAELSLAVISEGQLLNYSLEPKRHAWLQVARGIVTVNETALRPGDGAAIQRESTLEIKGLERAEVLLFDLAV